MTVHSEQSMKREDQQDATIRCLLLTSVSTCFGDHYHFILTNGGIILQIRIQTYSTATENRYLLTL